MKSSLQRCAVVAAVAATLALVGPLAATGEPDARCRTATDLLTRNDALAMTRARLAAGEALTVVTIGSSSTQGHGASSADRAYPAQLAALLAGQHADARIEVLNLGVGGEVATQMLQRFGRDVLAHHPQLVLWQTGANDAIRGVDLDEFSAALERGVALLRERGIDVILIPPQYAPRVVAAAGSEAYLERMHAIGARHGVPIFRRYAIMREVAVGKPDALASMLTADGLHLNDLGYRCLAVQLAASIDGRTIMPNQEMRAAR